MTKGIRYFKCRGVCKGTALFMTYEGIYDLPEGLSMIQCITCHFVTVAMDENALRPPKEVKNVQ